MSGEIAFGGWLKQRRKEQGVGPDLLAERIGCSGIALLKIEAGERRPSRQVALLLAEFLGVPEDEHEAFVSFARSGQPAAVQIPDSALPGESGVSPETAASNAPWRSVRPHKTNLPHLLTNLIGRNKETEEAIKVLMQWRVRLFTLTGPPGIGKTRLATHVASQLLENFDEKRGVMALSN